MKRPLLFLLLCFGIAMSGCKKDKPGNPEIEARKPEVLIENLTAGLAKADSVSNFVNALKNLSLTSEQTADGLTVFAPLNQTSGVNGRIGAIAAQGISTGQKSSGKIADVLNTTPVALTDSVLRDHIVKGVFKLTDLTNGKILTSLSGKQLKVSKSADTIWINGVQIGGKQIVNTNNEVVYTVKTVLTGTTPTDDLQSTSLEITVWDATLWSSSKSKGEVIANANVVLYRTQQNYADSVPAYQANTDATGKVIFKSLPVGTYYVKVSAGAKSNIFNRSAKQGGLYLGFANAGIFQTQAEITAAATQSASSPGDFKWLDSNGDGVINDNDRVSLPYERALAVNGTLKKAEISIGYLKNTQPLPFTVAEFASGLTQVETNMAIWQKNLAVADGLLSAQAAIDSIPAAFAPLFREFGNFSFSANNAGVAQIWAQGYEYISILGTLKDRAPATLTKRSEQIARLQASRAYIYLQLLSYFGNISLLQAPGTFSNSNRSSVYNYITADLQAGIDGLPTTLSGAANLNSFSAKVLYARAALLEKNYVKVSELTDSVINSAKYSLATTANRFASNSSELIWDNSANISANVTSYFFSRASLPYLRLTEVYLMNIEAAIAQGNTAKAQARYTALLQRSGLPAGTVSQANLNALWANEMRREGTVFLSMLRWGTANQNLAAKGFIVAKHSRLPIPQAVLQQNPGMVQNSGY